MSEGRFLALWVLAALVLSGVWGALSRLPAAFDLSLLAALCAFCWLGVREPRRSFASARGLPPPPRGPARLEAALALAAAALPTALFLALTWRQEFPFSGDQDFHLQAHLASAVALGPQLPWLLALAAALWWSARRRTLAWALPASFALLWAWSRGVTLPYGYARYPGLAYTLGLPLDLLARAARWDAPLDAARLENAALLAAWLLLLRPWLCRRWPDRRILPLCLFLFWQKDAVWLFGSGYLEPVAAVLCLLAAERLWDADGDEALDAVLLAGAAALAKEQAALLLPFALLAARPWALDARGRARAARVCAAALLPFLAYLLLRRAAGVPRGFALASPAQLLSAPRFSALAARWRFSLGASGLGALAAAAAAGVWACAAPGARRAKTAWLSAAGLFQLAFFYADRGSLAWTGYARFNLLGLALLGAALLELGRELEGRGPRARLAWAAAGLIGALNAASLAPFLSRAAALPDPYRSFTLHDDDPVFFDVAALERRAREQGALSGVTKLVLVDRLGTYTTEAWPDAYAGLRRRYRLGTWKAVFPGEVPACRCLAPDTALLVPFQLPVGLRAGRPVPGEDALRDRCERTLRETCAAVVEDRHGGDLLGLLGAGLKAGR